MSPSAALESPVFRIYVALAVGVLGVGAATIGVARYLFRKKVDHAWKAYRGWLVIIPLVFAVLFLGRSATIAFFTLVAIFAFKEFARATGLYDDWVVTGAVYLGILAVNGASLVPDPRTGEPGWYGLFMVLPAYVVAAILLIPIVRNRAQGQLQTVALAISGFLYIGWMFGHLGFLANSKYAYGYLMYLVFAVELNDVAAYTCGRIFGRHPLRSNISPKKTWEGSVGALAVSCIVPWLLWFSFPHFGPLELTLSGLIVGVGGQLGDLSMSVIKRDLGIKDMGALIPGHGGLLDRIDSLIYVVPLFFHMVRWFHGLY
ncbi:MAG: phosphatidate cytidylyltransferase [Planctomycetes bacterium]|nr:phosphatidate cytidylyltransferase [Planctomycetota bacterium]